MCRTSLEEHSEYPPLRFMRMVEKKVPHGLELLEEIHDSNGVNGLPSWPEWCYAPITSAVAVVNEAADYELLGDEEDIPIAEALSAVGAWRATKKVYVLEPDLEELLMQNKRLLSRFPSRDLVRTPAVGFYVQTSNLSVCDMNISGMFVSLDYDPDTHEQMFQVVFVYDFGDYTAFLTSVNEKSVFGTIIESLDEIVARYDVIDENGDFSGPFSHKNYHDLQFLMEKAMNIVVFLYMVYHYNEQDCFSPAETPRVLPFGAELDIEYLAMPKGDMPRSLKPFLPH